ncbi:hypothetical protein [uncultured Tenacibaculum sp.]|uniref:hypothetical protein n=1 Tax=uncultured Tenacibaculum sp. TaxID=174713 RepID=UPI00261002C6|nr:hypothetical protein [uncultured Tenacibaculum sp.]
MGENKHIEELDAFTKKYIKELDAKEPSIDFTVNIMQSILQTENAEVFKATPLISKKVWGVLFTILVVSIVYVSRGTSLNWVKMPKKILDYIPQIQMPDLFKNISISNTVLYVSFLFTIMIFLQIFFLKNHFTRKYNL